jgi:MarR family transcriptional regulator, organic hydroperoxide resistance regulator
VEVKKLKLYHLSGEDCCVDEVGTMVQRMVRIFQMFERDHIKPYGFTISQSYTMIEVLKNHQLTMNDLSNKMNLSISTMTRVVEKLVRDGYVKRSKSSEDKRVVLISLTNKGKTATERLDESICDYYKKIIQYLPKGQIEQVLSAVGLLFSAFEQANPNCC